MGIELDRRQVQSLSEEATKRVEDIAPSQSPSLDAFQREFYARPVLRVPSVIIPREYNYLLLPAAARFTAKILWVEPFRFDQRLFSAVEQM
jgi:hypothetical protein